MDKKVPIDVVLIPSKDVAELCKKLNIELAQEGFPRFDQGYTPHITLGMATVSESKLPLLEKELLKRIDSFDPFELEIEKFSEGAIAGFDIAISEKLSALQSLISDIVSPFDSNDSSPDDFYGGARKESVEWVNRYKFTHGSDSYSPHITLGIGISSANVDFPVTFMPEGMACFYLSDYCTCKKMLFTIK